MDSRPSYWITFLSTLVVSFLFGMPLTRTGMVWAAGLELDPSLQAWYVMLWAALFFGAVFFLCWLPMKDKFEGQRVVRTVAVGVLAFSALGVFDEGFAGKRLEAMMIPIGFALIIIGVFWYYRYQEQQRQMESPQE
jgi:hypothetical protein